MMQTYQHVRLRLARYCTSLSRGSKTTLAIGCCALALFFPLSLVSTLHAQEGFAAWLRAFRQDAQAQGISQATLEQALADIKPQPKVVELDRSQPEFIQTFSAYTNRRLSQKYIANGQLLQQQHQALLQQVEERYGVPGNVLMAFWGMETNYGLTQGSFSVPEALATLAFEGRRSDFFRTQLIHALRILDAGHVKSGDMKGSWAGAMGHMQFIPSTYNGYAVDGDQDGRIDLWQSVADAMHSAGNYLNRIGWRPAEPIAVEVNLPPTFDWQQAQHQNRKPLAHWLAAGVKPVRSNDMVTFTRLGASSAAILLPQGWRGPAFMVFDNFDVVMQWNRSVNYALSIAQLSDLIAGAEPLVKFAAAQHEALSLRQMMILQLTLTDLGFDAGEADGFPGPRTQAAIRGYQQAHGLPADGYASPDLLAHIAQAYAQHHRSKAPSPLAQEQSMLPANPIQGNAKY